MRSIHVQDALSKKHYKTRDRRENTIGGTIGGTAPFTHMKVFFTNAR